jgi:hypothetical protein
MKALETVNKKEAPTTYNRTKSDQDSVRYRHKTEPDFVGSGYHPPERFVPLLAKFSHPANATQRAQLFGQLQRHYGNRYVQRVISAYRSQNAEEEESKLASEIISKKGSGRSLANRAVQRLFKSGAIQAKLRISQPNDIYEQEADRVAEEVMRMPGTENSVSGQRSAVRKEDESIQTKPTCPFTRGTSCGEEEPLQTKPLASAITPLVQRQVEEEEEEEILQAKEIFDSTTEVTPNIEANINSLKGSGQPLPISVRAFFEPRFGYDFSQVRVHTDTRAAELARAVNARAFTLGKDVWFWEGRYSPGTSSGKRLIAHELTHVVQQRHVSHGIHHIQRACGRRAVGPTPQDCTLVSDTPRGTRFLFKVGCDEFAIGEQARLERFARTIPSTATINILGLASSDGDPAFNPAFNESLSCHRASVGESILHAQGLWGNIRSVRATGGIGTPGDRTLRAVDIEVIEQGPREEPPSVCMPQYDTTYGPNRSNCAAYQSSMARRFLTWTYRHNATCACENTPNDTKNNCVRKCLQVKLAAFLTHLGPSGAVIGTCLDPIGLLDFTCPEPYCRSLYNHHVECYRECCCENEFIGYPFFWFMCEAPYPCSFVVWTINTYNPCDNP